MKELHAQGKTIDDIVEVLKRAPIHPRIVPAIKAAHALGYFFILCFFLSFFLDYKTIIWWYRNLEWWSSCCCRCELRVVSDANMFFIETILEHLELREYFSEIDSNPSFVDEEEKLRIFPYHDFTKSSHGCNLCPPNMCKVSYFFFITSLKIPPKPSIGPRDYF